VWEKGITEKKGVLQKKKNRRLSMSLVSHWHRGGCDERVSYGEQKRGGGGSARTMERGERQVSRVLWGGSLRGGVRGGISNDTG